MRRLELFEHVVRREPAFAHSTPGRGGRERLEADRLFAFHFPLFLSELLDEVEGGDSHTVLAEWAEAFDWIAGTTTLGRAMVAGLDAADLAAAAAAAAGRDGRVAAALGGRLGCGPRLDRGRSAARTRRPSVLDGRSPPDLDAPRGAVVAPARVGLAAVRSGAWPSMPVTSAVGGVLLILRYPELSITRA